MSVEMLLVIVIGLPLVGSLCIPLFRLVQSEVRLRAAYAVAIAILTNFASWCLIPFGLSGKTDRFVLSVWPGLDWVLVVDALSIFMAVTASFLGMMIIIYSIDYMREQKHLSEYYLVVLLFIGSMMGLVFSAHLIFLYLFWEMSSFASWRLIGFYRKPEFVEKSGKAFLITFFGAVCMLLGFLLLFETFGTFDLTVVRGSAVGGIAILLILLGMFSKSATVPLHTWLPDAGVAPSTVTSLLHAAVLVKIGLYAFARIFNYALVLPDNWRTAIMWVALLSAFISACAALLENNIKRILAYSTVSQIGYIFIGFASYTAIGVAGALLYILAHGLAKAGLFLAAGIIEHGTGTKDITRMGGLSKGMPWTAMAFLLCSFSIIGLPPFGGFFAKFMVLSGAMQTGQPWIAAFGLVTASLTLLYLLRAYTLIFTGEARDTTMHAHHEGTRMMVGVVVVLAFLALLSGIVVHLPIALISEALPRLVHTAAEQLPFI
ncbi:MAG TPA: NADH-quinone oxidoreductase subunit L [bacterium]|nr:NADH-quinone oxidoreductase subunit L [bacterium]